MTCRKSTTMLPFPANPCPGRPRQPCSVEWERTRRSSRAKKSADNLPAPLVSRSIQTFSEHKHHVISVAMSADGHCALTAPVDLSRRFGVVPGRQINIGHPTPLVPPPPPLVLPPSPAVAPPPLP